VLCTHVYKNLLHSPCNGTNGIPLHVLRSPCSQALVPLSCRIASVVRVSERSWYHTPLSTNNSLLFTNDFNDVHRFRGVPELAPPPSPYVCWLGIVTHACMQASESAYFDLGPTVRVHHPNPTNATGQRARAPISSAPHFPCYARVA